ncbi:MAG: PEGA domain-containing protein [Planctomycetota bacterium]
MSLFRSSCFSKAQDRGSAVAVTAVTVLLIASSGCVRRRMTVRTNPPGATVSVDNQVIGVSPAATPFNYYGTREFRVEADGFRTETIRRRFNPPWYQWPGIDFVSETLWPGELRDERIIDVTLVPKTIPPEEEVIGRADSLRSQAASGYVTGPPR